MTDATAAVLDGLKDFQRRTVDYVCRRMLDEGANRFLVADEVGLGKTLVARGVVARTVERLRRDGVKRVDVVYICSNQEIARQNLKRLQLPGLEAAALPSRITLLPLHLADFQPDGVNFVSFTPGTSFEPRSRGGWTRERALLMRMLTPVWSLPRHKGVFEVFRLNARRSSLEHELRWMAEPDATIAGRFATAMRDSPLRVQLEGLIEVARRRALHDDERELQLELIGTLRRELAQCCVDALEPDLVILDEFQRFAELLDGESDAAELAHQLFSFSNERGEFARVLLLSATPYKAYSHAADDGASHQTELQRLLRFLFDDDERADTVRREFQALRERLLSGTLGEAELARERNALEASLTEVMCRTERLACSATRNGMLAERKPENLVLESADVERFGELARLHRLLRDRGLLQSSAAVTEYWKSAPWLAQFMDGYQFKRAIDDATQLPQEADPALAEALTAVREQLDWRAFRGYAELSPANARLRSLRHDTVDRTWDLLWLPPSMPYYLSGAPFDRFDHQPVTKRLVFSSWDVVPRAIAGFLSYEAERHAQKAVEPMAMNTPSTRKAHERRLLDFKLERVDGDQRPASMAILGMLAPSATLAELGDPRAAARALTSAGLPSIESLVDFVRDRIANRLATLDVGVDDNRIGADPRWYWAAPLLMDRDRVDARAFWEDPALAWSWTADQPGGIENFAQHVEEAQGVLAHGMELGRMPDDLAEVLAHTALAGPAVVATRAIRRVLPDLDPADALSAAARIGWGLRHLFNAPESIAVISATQAGRAYWRQALQYAVHGNLQAVLDEWLHVVAEDAGAGQKADAAALDDIIERVLLALSLGASRVEVDPLSGQQKVAWRTHFAARYGQAREDSNESVHPEAIRRAFNSPLRPFVLASTSVGQEGLDFHTYCHAVVHWNLPSNPVDLEQREGRVHRYKGHAVRRNVAEAFGAAAVRGDEPDAWAAAFDAARLARPEDQDDLVPFWLQPGAAQIERHVPALPYSRDAERYARVRRQVTLYRMVFGQPRQDDLIAYLQEQVGQAEAERLAELVRIDLSPKGAAVETGAAVR
jgi:hypothetical protein